MVEGPRRRPAPLLKVPDSLLRRVDRGRAEGLRDRLDAALRGRLARLSLTDNRWSLLACSPARHGNLSVRAHWIFVDLPDPLLAAAASLLAGELSAAQRRRTAAALRAFHAAGAAGRRVPLSPVAGRRTAPLVALGQAHDLAAIRDGLIREHLAAELNDRDIAIGWGRMPGKRRRRSIRLGSCSRAGCIRIHPALDHPSVPRHVVEAIVFHELLHLAFPPLPGPGGRRRVHPPAWRRRECARDGWQASQRWLATHLDDLLRRR